MHASFGTLLYAGLSFILALLTGIAAVAMLIFIIRALATKDTLKFLFGKNEDTPSGPPPEDYQ
ncbi:MAG TPA: hypothetical protein VGL77_00935 [Armatimonadota bacterium]|jgi:hypothetical protein